MTREQIIGLIKWTMKNYGSDAGDRAKPGSKLQSQAEYIADTIEAVREVQALAMQGNFHRFVKVVPRDFAE